MRIAIDYNAGLHQLAGIGRYTRDLVRALADLNTGDQFVLFYAARDVAQDAPGAIELREIQRAYPQIAVVPLPFPERWLTILWQRARVPIPVEYWTGPIDIVHAPDFVLPPSRTRRRLLTVHDLSFRIYPEAAHAGLRRYLNQAVPRSLRRATRVLADSQSTADDLQHLMNIAPSKMSVLYPGIGTRFQRIHDQHLLAQVRARYGLPERFLLHVGTIEPRKNLERLIAAFAQVRTKHPDVGLVLAGKPGWLADSILYAARETAGVILTGPVADADLPALYTLATGLVYPTLYEGFGFPPLEALACGTPAAASAVSSLPELAGNAMALFDPHDSSAIAAAIEQMLSDPSISERARTVGPEQAAQFSWERTAQRLSEIYRICMEK